MKITKVRATLVSLPADEALANFPNNPGGKRLVAACEIETDDGITGIGISMLANGMMPTVRFAIEQLGSAIIGMDPLRIEAVTKKMWDFGGNSGPGGIFTMALSAIDIALWDIKGKALNQPLWKLLGGDARQGADLCERRADARADQRSMRRPRRASWSRRASGR